MAFHRKKRWTATQAAGPRRRLGSSTNPFWMQIKQANERLDKLIEIGRNPLTPKGTSMIRNLQMRGENYVMNGKQVNYFTALVRQLWANN